MTLIRKNSKKEYGFTLLEVLVSFVILMGSIGLIYQFLISGMKRSESSSSLMTAVLIAQSKIAESDALPMRAEGEIEDFHWVVSKVLYQGESNGNRQKSIQLIHVNVNVVWESSGHERHFELESLRSVLK